MYFATIIADVGDRIGPINRLAAREMSEWTGASCCQLLPIADPLNYSDHVVPTQGYSAWDGTGVVCKNVGYKGGRICHLMIAALCIGL